MKKILISCLILTCTLGFTACSNFQFPGAYRIDIPQGNILKEDDINKLKVGMTKQQVRYVLGSPLTDNSFRPNVWTYFYSLKKGSKLLASKSINLTFNEKDILINIER